MATKEQRDPIFRARESFAFTPKGSGGAIRVVNQGDLLAPNDEAVQTRRDLVEPVTGSQSPLMPVVEQATAAPGELRTVPPHRGDAA